MTVRQINHVPAAGLAPPCPYWRWICDLDKPGNWINFDNDGTVVTTTINVANELQTRTVGGGSALDPVHDDNDNPPCLACDATRPAAARGLRRGATMTGKSA